MKRLDTSFYQHDDVVHVAKNLIGKVLVSYIDHTLTGGIIIETEAYAGIFDKASHAYNGRRTKRTETLYSEGGVAYVYQCYGMHFLLNVVTGKRNIPDAVLIRAILPTLGIEIMEKRRKTSYKFLKNFTQGPAMLCQALNIHKKHDKEDLIHGNSIWIEDHDIKIAPSSLEFLCRVGIDYAQEHALLPWRFCLEKSAVISLQKEIHCL